MSTVADMLPLNQSLIKKLTESRDGSTLGGWDNATVELAQKSSHTTRTRRSSTSSTAHFKGVRLIERMSKWDEKVKTLHTTCLAAVRELLRMQREQVCILTDHIKQVERGIPAIPENPEEAELYRKMAAQWLTVIKNVKDLDEMYTKKGCKRLSADQLGMQREIELIRIEIVSYLGIVTNLQTKLKKKNFALETVMGMLDVVQCSQLIA